MRNLKEELNTYCEVHWWNMGRKSIAYKGTLIGYLSKIDARYKRKKSKDFGYHYTFSISVGSGDIRYRVRIVNNYDFVREAQKFIQMYLSYMGDKSQIYLTNHRTRTVNK